MTNYYYAVEFTYHVKRSCRVGNMRTLMGHINSKWANEEWKYKYLCTSQSWWNVTTIMIQCSKNGNGCTVCSTGKQTESWQRVCMYLHLNSSIFKIKSTWMNSVSETMPFYLVTPQNLKTSLYSVRVYARSNTSR